MSFLEVIVYDDLPDVLTVTDVAAAMEISERSARRIVEDKGGRKICGKWYLPKSKFAALFEDESMDEEQTR